MNLQITYIDSEIKTSHTLISSPYILAPSYKSHLHNHLPDRQEVKCRQQRRLHAVLERNPSTFSRRGEFVPSRKIRNRILLLLVD